LVPGGVFLFDIAGPGRAGPTGCRRAFFSCEEHYLGFEEREERDARLVRKINVFVKAGTLYRRVEETHVLRLYAPEDIEALLTKTGFIWQRLARYADFDLLPAWHAYAARRAPLPAALH
jgi:hypothetical protein